MAEPLATGVQRVSAEPEAVDSPFVGMRPYRENEGHLLFGRARDAQLLHNKLYSSPLTLLYAPSGVGKTSLLTSLVVPRLRGDEDEASAVVYFEQWESASPLHDLKQAIVALHPGLDAGSDPAAPLASLLNAARKALERTIVLILDQFEQFLLRHPEQVDTFGRELGQAIKLAGGCYIVLSLREEFLASLQPFRQHIPTLMGSTYRLEYLAGDAARDAINGPIALFGAEIDGDLVNALLADLCAEARNTAELAALPQPGCIELPFLQLVCRRLWEHSDKKRLTLALYRDQLGGRDGVIKDYVQSVVAGFSDSEKDQLVEILRRLAPRSGVKKLYLIDELAAEAGLPEATVQRMLNDLEQHWVLRPRQTSGGTGYELYHDAFIKVLQPWIEQRVAASGRRARRRRRLRNVLVALGTLLVVAGLVVPTLRDRARVEGRIEALAALAADDRGSVAVAEWSELAAYLWGKNSDTATRRLIDLLRARRELVPRNFLDDPALADVLPEARVAAQELRQRAAGAAAAWPVAAPNPGTLAISVHPDRPLNVLNLFRGWRIGATRTLARSGLPLPTRIKVFHDRDRSESLVTFSRPGDRKGNANAWVVNLDVPARADWIIVLDEDLSNPRAKAAMDLLHDDERLRIERWGTAESGWYVPRWSAPLWKAAGVRALPHEFEIAMAFRDRIQRYPELVLDDEAAAFLIGRERSVFCDTVGEAEAVRGGLGRLRQDLVEIARRGRPLHGLGGLLDQLAAFPAEIDSPTAADAVAGGDAGKLGAMAPLRHAVRKDCVDDPPEPVVPPWRLRDQLFPLVYNDIRVRLDPALAQRLQADADALAEPLRALRADTYLRRGVMPPPIRPEAAEASEIGAHEVQILLPGEPPFAARKLVVREPDIPGQIVGAIAERLQASLPQMVRAETIRAALGELPPGLAAPLREHYSLTDLKLILRAVLQPAVAGAAVPPEHTLAQLPWLLGSLAYWTGTCPARAQDCLVNGLRATQAGRLARAAGPAGHTLPADADVRQGIDALIEGRMPEAQAHFANANRRNARLARTSFLALWPEQARYVQGRQITASGPAEERCETYTAAAAPELAPPALPLRVQLEISDHLAARQPGGSDADPLSLHLCLLRAAVVDGSRERANARWQSLRSAVGEPKTWTADARFNAGYILLEGVQRRIFADEQVKEATDLLKAGLVPLASEPRAEAFERLLGVCRKARYEAWCRNALREVQAGVSDDFWLSLKLAVTLADSAGSRDDARAALGLLDQVEPQLAGFAEPERARVDAWVVYARANALFSLAYHGDAAAVPTAATLFRRQLSARPSAGDSWPPREDAWSALVALELMAGRLDAAEHELVQWQRDLPPTALQQQMLAFVRFAGSDRAGLRNFAEDVARQGAPNLDEQFAALVSALVTARAEGEILRLGRAFLDTSHPYRDYVLMLLYWNLGGDESVDARKLIAGRWSTINRSTWEQRLQRGEYVAWQERLVGYTDGKLKRDELFSGLESEQVFATAPLSRIGQPYGLFLTEAHFYDALRQAVTGDAATRVARMTEALQRAVATNHVSTWEYHMARYLLKRQPAAGGPG